MKTTKNEEQARKFAHRIRGLCSVGQRRASLLLLIVLVACASVSTAHAQTLIGSPGAGWQTWTVTPISSTQPDLNDNGAPWWDLQWAASGSYGNSTFADKNPGFCMTATGDCVGIGSAAL